MFLQILVRLFVLEINAMYKIGFFYDIQEISCI